MKLDEEDKGIAKPSTLPNGVYHRDPLTQPHMCRTSHNASLTWGQLVFVWSSHTIRKLTTFQDSLSYLWTVFTSVLVISSWNLFPCYNSQLHLSGPLITSLVCLSQENLSESWSSASVCSQVLQGKHPSCFSSPLHDVVSRLFFVTFQLVHISLEMYSEKWE